MSHVFIGGPGLLKGQGFEKASLTLPVSVSAYFTTNGLILNGVMGVDGNKGDTAVFAYQVLTSAAMPAAPSIGAATVPISTVNTALAVGATSTTQWYTTPKTTLLANEWQFQVSGTKSYLGVYTWQTQGYLSTFKVGKLDALSAEIGTFSSGSPGSNRTIIKDSMILVVDNTNKIRVRIGDLSTTVNTTFI
jgi:hypothetical protein